MSEAAEIARLRECLYVEGGRLFWREDRRVGRGRGRVHVRAGDEAGCIGSNGYRVFRLDGKLYSTHRAIWAMLNGRWPSELDHINRDRADNRPENLREVTSAQNKANTGLSCRNTSGRKGVSWNKDVRKWQATANLAGKSTYLGVYSDIEAAAEAYRIATQHKAAA